MIEDDIMYRYEYKAVDSTGKIYKSKIEYSSEAELIEYLKSKDMLPIEIKQLSYIDMDLNCFIKLNSKISTKDIAIFFRQLSTILNSGISESIAVDIVAQQTESKALRKSAKRLSSSIQKGNLLSEAMYEQNIFSEFTVSVIKAGELSGKLGFCLKSLSEEYEKKLKFESQIKSSMIYPAIISFLMLILISTVTVFVIPNYIKIFDEVELQLPYITTLLLNIVNCISTNIYTILAILVAFAVLIFIFKSCTIFKNIIDSIVLSLPLISKSILKINISTFSKNMSILLEAGIPIVNSLEITYRTTKNAVIKKAIKKIILDVSTGISFSTAIQNTRIFPNILSSMVKIGEQTDLSSETDMLFKVYEFYQQDVNRSIENFTKFIEPILTILLAFVLGFIMIAILLPTFNLATQIS